MGTNRARSGKRFVHKMLDLEAAYRDIREQDRELIKLRPSHPHSRASINSQTDPTVDLRREIEEREKQIIKLKYTVSKLEESLKTSKTESENARRNLKNEQDGRAIVDKKMKGLEKENKDLRGKMSAIRVKLGVANANYNVGKHETEDLRNKHQQNQIQIARLEERLTAANQELSRLRDPLNPDGSEEVKRKIQTDKKELKALRVEIQKLEERKVLDEKTIEERDLEITQLLEEMNKYRIRVANLETDLEMAEVTLQAEKASREEFENENKHLSQERENFDDTIKQFKVKLGLANASKNVNVKQAELLRKQDEEYQFTIQNLEKRLRAAKAEIDRLQARDMEAGKTASSLQTHNKRLKRHRNTFNMEFITPRSFEGTSGWTPTRSTPRMSSSQDRVSRVSVSSVTSVKTQSGATTLPPVRPVGGVKHGRRPVS